MISLKLVGDNLHVKTETFMGGQQYKSFMDYMNSIPEMVYLEEDYTWIVPKTTLDGFLEIFSEDGIAWFNSIEEIRGTEQPVLPTMDVTDEGLHDMKLKPYPFQTAGICFLHDNKRGILGDQMGLGKSIQGIGAFHRLKKSGVVEKALVICPTSLKYQWAEEIKKFTYYTSTILDGTPKKREKQFQSFLDEDSDFLIINYEMLRNKDDLARIQSVEADVLICDEIHKIKNQNSQTSKAVKKLKAEYKFGLTGTPMQNRLDELWNIMDWLDPSILGQYWPFRKRYIATGEKFGKRNVEIGYKRLGEVREKVGPLILRRMKEDVAPELPELLFNTYNVEMTPTQRKIQMEVMNEMEALRAEIEDFETKHPGEYNEAGEWEQPRHPKEDQVLGFLNILIANANSPELLRMSESGMVKRFIGQYKDDTFKSPKLNELKSICEDALEQGNKKVVIFTQFSRMQDLARDTLTSVGGVEILNGSMTGEQRQAAIENFRDNPAINFFLLTDAGNFGLNLQFAHLLVNIESPWNPAVVEQRAGRVHRIGSDADVVNIISLVAMDSIDEQIQDVLEEKRQLSGQIIEKRDNERSTLNNMIKRLMK